MVIIKGSLFDVLYNNGMLSVLIRIISSNEYTQHTFPDKIRKFP